jgi:hypothetical protein
MILRIEPMLVTLQEQRNRFLVRLAIGAVKIVCTVEFVFGVLYARGVGIADGLFRFALWRRCHCC